MMDKLVVLDCEVYPNYFLAAFKSLEKGKVVKIEAVGEDVSLSDKDLKSLRSIITNRTTFGYNSNNYDIPIILYALTRATCREIYKMSEYIIGQHTMGWMTLKAFNLKKPGIKHFDIMEPSPGVKISLKLYGARIHSKRLQDLPIEPGTILTNEEIQITRDYCVNDLDTTIDLYNSIQSRIKLRADMSKTYGQDLLSKSDAQIAESVIKSELRKDNPFKFIKAPKMAIDAHFRYSPPSYIKFENKQLKDILNFVENYNFELDHKGSIKLPDRLSKSPIKIGKSTYQIGVGGLHSKEKRQIIIPTDNELLLDRDVTSHYPSIILNENIFPKHLGSKFLSIYGKIVKDRLKAKREGNTDVNESLKVVLNGSFGKFGSKWSCLYSPDLLIAVTLTGQLSLLMLIEQLEGSGISVVSANTDGFVCHFDKSKYDTYDTLCLDWEIFTGCGLEETRYKALYSRDVNNYFAIADSYEKGKGVFTLDGLNKNPSANVCIIAVKELLVNGTPIEDTINSCKDLTKFLIARAVTGGAYWGEDYLGKVVRWIYSTKGQPITYKTNGNKVAKSEDARPIMELESFPEDINYDKYISEALKMLEDLGYEGK
jgi:hypothetical protein